MAEDGQAGEIAPSHTMDIPHVSAVELPLIVKNTDKALDMLGGKNKLVSAVNALNRPAGTGSTGGQEHTLELRLRNDPFHHPVQSSLNTNEKILLKVSIPTKSLPSDYRNNPSKYPIRQLVRNVPKDSESPVHVQPVAIINRTFSFKAISDFQVNTKHNEMVQEFNKAVYHSENYTDINTYFEKHNKFTGIADYKDAKNYENKDHSLPPPPVFSPIRFPFDYKYQKNPLTTLVKNSESGEVKVVAKKNTLKLHTRIIDFDAEPPTEAAKPLLDNLEHLSKQNLALNSLDFHLLECIKWLQKIFEVKPIWLRKQLEDLVPTDLKRVIKQALPYVSFIYKSGPWRFCNVKFGVNPRGDKAFWVYQSEYFRIPGLHFNSKKNESSNKIVPNTIKNSKASPKLEVSDFLLFDGKKAPLTVTYQVGDILDANVIEVIEKAQESKSFFRDSIDFQDGWISRQTMETIRRIVRYKLACIVKETPIESSKLDKILETEYDEDDCDPNDAEEEDRNESDSDSDADVEEEVLESTEDISEEDLRERLKHLDSTASDHLKNLVGFIKQDSLSRES